METHKKIREHISALSDGALCSSDVELAMAAMQTTDGRQTWNLYHQIGDVIRAQATPDLSDDFSARLAAKLDQEAAPVRRSGKSVAAAKVAPVAMHLQVAAGGSEQRAQAAMACEISQDGVAVAQVKPPVNIIS